MKFYHLGVDNAMPILQQTWNDCNIDCTPRPLLTENMTDLHSVYRWSLAYVTKAAAAAVVASRCQ